MFPCPPFRHVAGSGPPEVAGKGRLPARIPRLSTPPESPAAGQSDRISPKRHAGVGPRYIIPVSVLQRHTNCGVGFCIAVSFLDRGNLLAVPNLSPDARFPHPFVCW